MMERILPWAPNSGNPSIGMESVTEPFIAAVIPEVPEARDKAWIVHHTSEPFFNDPTP